MSRTRRPIVFDPFSASPRTPGSLGHNDAADPDRAKGPLGDTPSSLGFEDRAEPTYLAGPVVAKSKPVLPTDAANYFGPGGALVTPSGNVTTIVRCIPLVPQLSPMSCWVAAGKMVLGHPPSVTSEMWTSRNPNEKAEDIGGLDLLKPGAVQKFMQLNGLILYPKSDWTLKGVESRLRTRSAFFYPVGLHVVVVAGIKVDRRNPNASTLIIYDPKPINKGLITEENWGNFVTSLKASRELDIQDHPDTAPIWKKQGWRGLGTFFLHR